MLRRTLRLIARQSRSRALRPERECRDGKNHAVKEGGESGNELSTGEIGGGIPRVCRGRDDWECDFCGVECFCWTVESKMTELW